MVDLGLLDPRRQGADGKVKIACDCRDRLPGIEHDVDGLRSLLRCQCSSFSFSHLRFLQYCFLRGGVHEIGAGLPAATERDGRRSFRPGREGGRGRLFVYSVFVQRGGTPPPIEFVRWPMPELTGSDDGLRATWRYPRPLPLEELEPDLASSLNAASTVDPDAAAWCDALYKTCFELYRAAVGKVDRLPSFNRRASPDDRNSLRRARTVRRIGGITDWWRALFPPDFGDVLPWQMSLDAARWPGCVRLPLRERPDVLGVFETLGEGE